MNNESEKEVLEGFGVERNPYVRDGRGKGKKVAFFNREVFLEDSYYVYSPDRKRTDLTKEQMNMYLSIKNLRGHDTIKYLMQLNMYHPDCNPNIHTLTGRQLVEFSEEFSAVPVFDKDFPDTHRLQFQPLSLYKFLMEKKKLRDAKEKILRGEM